jgi:hypothetical protein
MSSELKVDTISEKTTASGVTIDSVLIKNGSINANGTGRKNYIINGNFDIWQRGTSVTGGYGPDRFVYQNSGSTGTFAQGSFTAGQTDVPNNPKYFANLTITGADDEANIAHRIEDVNTLSGETATISFYAKHTTNAPTSFNVTSYQVFGSGGSTAVETSIATSQTTTTSWQKYTATVTFPSVSGKTIGAGSYLEVLILNPNNETYDIQIAQVQLEKGSVATDFEVRPIGEELALCQRYYEKSYSIEDTPASSTYNGINNVSVSANGNSDSVVSIRFKVEKRTSPTVTGYTNAGTVGNWTYYRSGVSPTSGTITIDRQCTSSARLYVSVGASWVACDLWGHWVADAEL